MKYVQSPKSNFLKVKCNECEHEMIIFNHAKTVIKCQNESCDFVISEPHGGKSDIHAEILSTVDEL